MGDAIRESILSRWVQLGVGVTGTVSSLLIALVWLTGAMTTPADIKDLRQEVKGLATEIHAGLRPAEVNNHLSALDARFDRDEERLRLDEDRITRIEDAIGDVRSQIGMPRQGWSPNRK